LKSIQQAVRNQAVNVGGGNFDLIDSKATLTPFPQTRHSNCARAQAVLTLYCRADRSRHATRLFFLLSIQFHFHPAYARYGRRILANSLSDSTMKEHVMQAALTLQHVPTRSLVLPQLVQIEYKAIGCRRCKLSGSSYSAPGLLRKGRANTHPDLRPAGIRVRQRTCPSADPGLGRVRLRHQYRQRADRDRCRDQDSDAVARHHGRSSSAQRPRRPIVSVTTP
jgi:hypothetical protein